jgi:SAM-dependent methyltransferase
MSPRSEIRMKLKRPLPEGRSHEQVEHHYLVEKALADQLKNADRAGRRRIYETMYDELFRQVPDHPRLTRRHDEGQTWTANRGKLSLVRPFLKKTMVYAEFAPGDCRFSAEVAGHVKQVYGIDISDQRGPNSNSPENFELIVYDGYHLDRIAEGAIDIAFSDQLVEHFHPEDTETHFQNAHRILRDGWKYGFRTPHRFMGPCDVSQYFCDEAEGFHLKEWTLREIVPLLKRVGFSRVQTYWCAKGMNIRVPYLYFGLMKKLLDPLPKNLVRKLSRYLVPTVSVVAIK